jgi:hypothetical protein
MLQLAMRGSCREYSWIGGSRWQLEFTASEIQERAELISESTTRKCD